MGFVLAEDGRPVAASLRHLEYAIGICTGIVCVCLRVAQYEQVLWTLFGET